MGTVTCATQGIHVPAPGIPSGSAFPPASRAALSPREPLVEGVGESSSNSLPTGLPAGLNAARSGTNIPWVTELSPGGPHDAGSSSSSPAGEWPSCRKVSLSVSPFLERRLLRIDTFLLSSCCCSQRVQGHAAGE